MAPADLMACLPHLPVRYLFKHHRHSLKRRKIAAFFV